MISRKINLVLALTCLVGFANTQATEQVLYGSNTETVQSSPSTDIKDQPNCEALPAVEEVTPAEEIDGEAVRVLPEIVELEIQGRRAEEAEGYAIKEGVLEKSVKAASWGIDLIHPNTYHYPYSHAVNGEDITLQDLSKWYVYPYDRLKTLNWASTDLIFVKPNTSWFSSYTYILYNERLGEQVEVNLIRNYVVAMLWIMDIDLYNGFVVLNDGSTWPLNSNDYSVYKYWRIGDRIIVGINHMWRNGVYPYILIDADLKNAPYCESL